MVKESKPMNEKAQTLLALSVTFVALGGVVVNLGESRSGLWVGGLALLLAGAVLAGMSLREYKK